VELSYRAAVPLPGHTARQRQHAISSGALRLASRILLVEVDPKGP